jgi:U3 small nucleolar RNA-associated protein 19
MIPAYLAAACIKHLARLSHTNPTPSVCVCASFIFNSLRRHPSCSCFLHCGAIVSQPADIASAPKGIVKPLGASRPDLFDDSVSDPALANAMSCSLWELQLLKQHASTDVARLMEAFDTPITRALRVQSG